MKTTKKTTALFNFFYESGNPGKQRLKEALLGLVVEELEVVEIMLMVEVEVMVDLEAA